MKNILYSISLMILLFHIVISNKMMTAAYIKSRWPKAICSILRPVISILATWAVIVYCRRFSIRFRVPDIILLLLVWTVIWHYILMIGGMLVSMKKSENMIEKKEKRT